MNKGFFGTRFSEYETARRQLFCKLTDPNRLAGGCGDMPSRPWMDLRISCYYDMAEDGLPDCGMVIRNDCLSLWHVSGEQVLEDAWKNTVERQRILFSPLDRVLREMEAEREWTEGMDFRERSPLYILTNTERMFGAVYMAVPEVLGLIGEKLESDFYILPSSIHECMILPVTEPADEEGLNRMVSVINRDCVEDAEILADHVYFYDRLLRHVRAC